MTKSRKKFDAAFKAKIPPRRIDDRRINQAAEDVEEPRNLLSRLRP